MKPIIKKGLATLVLVSLSGFSIFKHQESNDYQAKLKESQIQLRQLEQEHQTLESRFKSLEMDFSTFKKDNEAYISFGKNAKKIEQEQKDLAQCLSKDQEGLKAATQKLDEEKANLQKEKENLQKEKDSLQQERNNFQAEKAQFQQGQASSAPVQSSFATSAPAQQAVYFQNCREARAAGAAPVRLGDPGYARHLDRDGDGIGCE